MKTIKKNLMVYSLLVSILLLTSFCHNPKKLIPAKELAKKKALSEIKQFPARQLAHYQFSALLTIEKRINRHWPEVLRYLQQYDGKPEYRIYHPTIQETELIQKVWQSLPPVYQKTLKHYLVGIYFVENFWGNGFAEWVLGENDQPYAFIAMNKVTLKQTIEEMLIDRERSNFKNNDSSYQLSIHINDKNLPSLYYMMLHEGIHVLDYVMQLSPFTDPSYRDYYYQKMRTPAESLITEVWKDYSKPVLKFELNHRAKISFYGFKKGPHIPLSEAVLLYRDLSHSPWVTLYATQNWAEDYAELGAQHFLKTHYHQDLTLTVQNNKKIEFVWQPHKYPLITSRMNQFAQLLSQREKQFWQKSK